MLATACTGTPKPSDTMPITTPTTTGTTGTTGTSASTSGSASTSSTTAPSSTSSAPSTTRTPGVPPPVANIPLAARKNTPEGAQEFVKYFLGQLQKAWDTPDPSALDGLWEGECGVCKSYYGTALQFKKNHQRFAGSVFEIKAANMIEQAQGFTVVLVAGRAPASRVVDSSGSTVRSIAAQSGLIEYTLWFKDHWQVTRVGNRVTNG